MLCGLTAEHWSPSPLLREDWLSASREWRASEMRCRPGTAGAPAEGGRAAAAAAGKEEPTDTGTDTGTGTDTAPMDTVRPVGPGPRECTSSPWRRERGRWPSTTPFPCARIASQSTARCSSSARITSSENTPKRSPNGHILYLAVCSE